MEQAVIGANWANSVIDEWNFRSSGWPKISSSSAAGCSAPLRAGAQPRAQQWVLEIGSGFFARTDREASGHLAATQPGELREHKPHPVATLAALIRFALSPFEHRVLRLNALQVERVVADRCFSCEVL
jgi:hypothetical protein